MVPRGLRENCEPSIIHYYDCSYTIYDWCGVHDANVAGRNVVPVRFRVRVCTTRTKLRRHVRVSVHVRGNDTNLPVSSPAQRIRNDSTVEL